MFKSHTIGVVIPAYMVERHIAKVISSLPEFIDSIYVVNDGSPDKTTQVVKQLNHPRVKFLQHKVNSGPGAALMTGYQSAWDDKIDIVVKIDGDGQMPWNQIENLINPIIENVADYTKGDRLSNPDNRRNMPRLRLFGNYVLSYLTRLASGYWNIYDSQNGFTAISHQALEDIIREKFYSYKA